MFPQSQGSGSGLGPDPELNISINFKALFLPYIYRCSFDPHIYKIFLNPGFQIKIDIEMCARSCSMAFYTVQCMQYSFAVRLQIRCASAVCNSSRLLWLTLWVKCFAPIPCLVGKISGVVGCATQLSMRKMNVKDRNPLCGVLFVRHRPGWGVWRRRLGGLP